MDLSPYTISDIKNCFLNLDLEFTLEKENIFKILLSKSYLVPNIRGNINSLRDYILKWDIKYNSKSFFEDLGDYMILDEIELKLFLLSEK